MPYTWLNSTNHSPAHYQVKTLHFKYMHSFYQTLCWSFARCKAENDLFKFLKSLLHFVTNCQSNIVYPQYFVIQAYGDLMKFSGFYRRTSDHTDEKPAYKQPRVDIFLHVKDNLWTIETNTDKKVLYLEGDCDLPTS